MFAEIRNRQGERLDLAHHPASGGGADLVVIGHGVTANKDRAFLVALAEGLAASGIAALRVSWSGNGDSEGRFEDSTISKEVEDLGAVLDALGDHRIAYVGHSMGGAVGVLRASRDERIGALVSLAGMVDTAGSRNASSASWCPGATRCGQARVSVVADVPRRHGGDRQRRTASRRRHGAVVAGARYRRQRRAVRRLGRAREASSVRAELVRIEGADHLFSEHTPAMVDVTVSWLRKQLA